LNESARFPSASPPHGGYFDDAATREELKKYEEQMLDPAFWNTPDRAKVIAQQVSEIRRELETWDVIEKDAADLKELAAGMKPEEESEFRPEVEKQMAELEKKFSELEFLVLFSGRYDAYNAILTFHAGSGGTEAQDWAEMLFRMITRFCEKKGWTVRMLNESKGQEAGLKSATIEVIGRHAYGYLRSEHGVHRLVRISPFDAAKARHTSFALIEVLPDIGDTADVKIDPKDLRIDTFLSGGHGGQGVQTTYSAVRIVHIPTGIMTTCQNERSQQQNRENAMKMLKAKLAAIEEEKHQKNLQGIRGEYHSAEWGNQARSYVLQPYRMVKDHRTKHKTSDTDGVLNGNFDEFIEAYLKWMKDPEAYLKSHAQDDEDEE
jgi:peptide chain release factor 2